MADPVLDEDHIIDLLRSPPALDSIEALQAGAVRALVDMYDRGMTRDEFCEHASKCLALYAQCAKLWLLKNIQAAHEQRPLTEHTFKQAHDGIAEVIRAQAAEVIGVVQRLQACPTSKDKIH